jgi:hypothetical protein
MFVEGKKTLASYVPEAAVAGGVMWLLALLLPELIPAEQGSGADYHVTNVPLFSLYVALGAVAFLIFPIAVSGLRLRAARQETPMGLAGKIGTILVWVGAALVVVQFVTLIAGAISGTPSQFWILFFFGAPTFQPRYDLVWDFGSARLARPAWSHRAAAERYLCTARNPHRS